MKVHLVWENHWSRGVVFHGLFKTESEAESYIEQYAKEYEVDEIYIKSLECPI